MREHTLSRRGFISASRLSPTKPKVLIIIPGRADDGLWVDKLRERWSHAVIIEKATLGNVSALEFLTRSTFADVRVHLRKQLRQLVHKHKGLPISVACHSYATDVFTSIVGSLGVTFETVLFLAAVCPEQAASVVRRHCVALVNDCGTRDIWPFVAKCINRAHYECTGIFGFNQTAFALDRKFPYGHLRYLKEQHFTRYVLPAILHGRYEGPLYRRHCIPLGWSRRARDWGWWALLLLVLFPIYLVADLVRDGLHHWCFID